MSAAEIPLLNRLLNRAPLARLRDVAFAAACRLHLVRLDRVRAERAQLRTLLGLVHRARRTLFGVAHDFSRIRTLADFRRLVPLRSPAALFQKADVDVGALLACHRRALRTAFALLHAAAPRARLLRGKLVCDDHRRTHLPALVRPSLHADGPPRCAIEDDALRIDGGAKVELVTLPEAPIAVEDARAGGLRLLVDHGVFFEFVPVGRNERLGIADVRERESYELAITSPGGWWACRSGLFVTFERLNPPVVRLVPAPRTGDEPARETPTWSRPTDAGSLLMPQAAPWTISADSR